MFKTANRFKTGVDSIPLSTGIKLTLCFVDNPELKEVMSKPKKDKVGNPIPNSTFPLIRFNNVKLVDFEITKKSIVDDKALSILTNMELESISAIEITKAMSNVLMDAIDNLDIQLNDNFFLEKIEGKESEFDNTIKITKK